MTSRDFLKAARQRLTTAVHLHRNGFNLDAQYLGGYAVECALKGLILHLTVPPRKPQVLRQLTSGARMHRPDVLLDVLRNQGVLLPLRLTKRMRKFDWTTSLRYQTGRRDSGETTAFLKTAEAVCKWVEDQLP